MRSNRSVLDGYLPVDDLGGGTLGEAPAQNCMGVGVTCENSQIAAFDQWHWEQELDGAVETLDGVNTGGLVEPTGCISGPVGGDSGVYEVAIAWRGSAEHTNPVIHDCGEDSGKYGSDNEFRHVLVIQTFINNS